MLLKLTSSTPLAIVVINVILSASRATGEMCNPTASPLLVDDNANTSHHTFDSVELNHHLDALEAASQTAHHDTGSQAIGTGFIKVYNWDQLVGVVPVTSTKGQIKRSLQGGAAHRELKYTPVTYQPLKKRPDCPPGSLLVPTTTTTTTRLPVALPPTEAPDSGADTDDEVTSSAAAGVKTTTTTTTTSTTTTTRPTPPVMQRPTAPPTTDIDGGAVDDRGVEEEAVDTWEWIRKNYFLETFTEAVKAAELDTMFKDKVQKYTIFAFRDKAIVWTDLPMLEVAEMKKIIYSYIVKGVYYKADIRKQLEERGSFSLTTMAGNKIQFFLKDDGRIALNNDLYPKSWDSRTEDAVIHELNGPLPVRSSSQSTYHTAFFTLIGLTLSTVFM